MAFEIMTKLCLLVGTATLLLCMFDQMYNDGGLR